MAILHIIHNGATATYPFQPPAKVGDVLLAQGLLVEHPCGGAGKCGKCRIRIQGQLSDCTPAERAAGHRLSCQAEMLGDCVVWLAKRDRFEIQVDGPEMVPAPSGEPGYGIAVDIGTTTVAAKLYHLATGTCLASAAERNPQRAVAADVIGRIDAALHGRQAYLQEAILRLLEELTDRLCQDGKVERRALSRMVVTGNTTMLYLLEGLWPECLSRAPFEADTLFDAHCTLLGTDVYYPPCMNAFVGADITCAVLASGMWQMPQTSLLCDIGTNGEIALWHGGKLYVASTAAGPALEGAGISCGCSSIAGAICQVWPEAGRLRYRTVQDAPAVGLCGSGLLDAVAAGLELGLIDETGYLDAPNLPLAEGVVLTQKDIRNVQLAKAAIAAGIETLLQHAQVDLEQVGTLYIAGGFGSHLNVNSACALGLFPEALKKRASVIGNAALSGAAQILLDPKHLEQGRQIARTATFVGLGGNKIFNEAYVAHMLFE